jgi:long-subunit fatty acid transport protein
VIPPSVSSQRNYKDVFGVRLGGDYAILRDKLAVRAGGFFESSAGDSQFQNIDFAASWRLGFGLGGTFRQRFGNAGALDVMFGFAHVFFGTQENNGPDGLTAISGTPCNPTATAQGSNCPTGAPKYRTNWPVNLGTITNSVNSFNLGLAYRF